MRGQFKKGWTYIVYSEFSKSWYIVRQTSQRTWVAMNFTHLGVSESNRSISRNGVDLWDYLDVGIYRTFREVPEDQKYFRKSLFEICQYGKFIKG